MRRIRWGRVAMAGATVCAGGAAPFALSWEAGPEPAPQVRHLPGPADCATGERLEAAADLHDAHGDALDPQLDAVAAAAVLAAARCGTLQESDLDLQFDVYHATLHAIRWIVENEPTDRALDDLLALWELAVGQRRVGVLINAATWFAIELQVAQEVEKLLSNGVYADPHLRDRLLAIARAELDWAEVYRRDETVGREVLWEVLQDSPLGALSLWWVDRRGDTRIAVELQLDERRVRTAAAVLAAAADPAICADPTDLQAELAPLRLDLAWFPERCAVVGRAGEHTLLGVGRR